MKAASKRTFPSCIRGRSLVSLHTALSPTSSCITSRRYTHAEKEAVGCSDDHNQPPVVKSLPKFNFQEDSSSLTTSLLTTVRRLKGIDCATAELTSVLDSLEVITKFCMFVTKILQLDQHRGTKRESKSFTTVRSRRYLHKWWPKVRIIALNSATP